MVDLTAMALLSLGLKMEVLLQDSIKPTITNSRPTLGILRSVGPLIVSLVYL